RTFDISLVHSLRHKTIACCFKFSVDGKYSETSGLTPSIYEAATGAIFGNVSDLNDGEIYIRSMDFGPDGRYLAPGAEDEKARDVEKAVSTVAVAYEKHRMEASALEFSSGARRSISGAGWYGAVLRYGGSRTAASRLHWAAMQGTPGIEGDTRVMDIAVSPSGVFIAVGCAGGLVRVWSL
ncbi:hypothetical protein R3P38DRAFT_2539232, partial [Favolaschia claudopus]